MIEVSFYHGSLPKERMREELIRYHASIIPFDGSYKGAVPSKLFGFAAVRRSYLVLRRRRGRVRL